MTESAEFSSTQLDVTIVGNGLFGSTIAAEMKRLGRAVTMVDADRPYAGSKPAACLMKPSWFSSLGSAIYDPALRKLDELFGVQDLEFTLPIIKRSVRVHWVPPEKILKHGKEAEKGTVTAIGVEENQIPWFRLKIADKPAVLIKTKMLILATGVWTNKLVRLEGLTGRAGMAFYWSGYDKAHSVRKIIPYLPYKQIVVFHDWKPGLLWAGDGTSVKAENWNEERAATSKTRCANAADLESWRATPLYGVRPYMAKAKPCYFEEVLPNIFVATGGAKNGTVAAGWCAHQLGLRAT